MTSVEHEPVSVISAPYCEHKMCCTRCKRRKSKFKRKGKQKTLRSHR